MVRELPEGALVATSENIYEVVAMLRPDLCLVSRRELDVAIAAMLRARNPLLLREGSDGG